MSPWITLDNQSLLVSEQYRIQRPMTQTRSSHGELYFILGDMLPIRQLGSYFTHLGGAARNNPLDTITDLCGPGSRPCTGCDVYGAHGNADAANLCYFTTSGIRTTRKPWRILQRVWSLSVRQLASVMETTTWSLPCMLFSDGNNNLVEDSATQRVHERRISNGAGHWIPAQALSVNRIPNPHSSRSVKRLVVRRPIRSIWPSSHV